MKKIIYGSHWTTIPEGWLDIPQSAQDLTAPLKQPDNSVDVVYTEHVLEHLEFTDAVLFFKEAFRVLKPGGIIRTVCPFIDVMAGHIANSRGKDRRLFDEYFKNSIAPYYPSQIAQMEEIGINPSDHWQPFLIDSLVKNHGHKFIWDRALMTHVLERIGFSEINNVHPGHSFFDEDTCLERRVRGVSQELVEAHGYKTWDCESGIIEARK